MLVGVFSLEDFTCQEGPDWSVSPQFFIGQIRLLANRG